MVNAAVVGARCAVATHPWPSVASAVRRMWWGAWSSSSGGRTGVLCAYDTVLRCDRCAAQTDAIIHDGPVDIPHATHSLLRLDC